MNETTGAATSGRERRLSLTIVANVIPALAVAFVGAYGFGVWFYQIIAGPPGAL